MAMSSDPQSSVPYRQIRALYDEKTITLYQAYSASIADAAVRRQKLSASPDFKFSRMTWIKPSYSLKDARQSRILALTMTHANFHALLSEAIVVHGQTLSEADKAKPVRVQWDPERGPKLEVKDYRSIQIGIGEGLSRKWAEEWIVGIEDVTERALGLKRAVARKVENDWSEEALIGEGWLPKERVYEVPKELRRALRMDE
ncbi:hypothetical protein D0Z07_0602 [Hyphodiscus hymeniophilus]|uniref:Uncharacterized protein n=1 Tax=Hyphodiscus hymeniophilus TaxID=353542 RepID=A0A9P6VRG2_9HELO|nr:hypothetical protein D0Z07_0602 [Hyphodiscus hymeniophilus]